MNTLSEWQHRFTTTETNTEYSGTPSLSLPKEFRPNLKKNYMAHRDTTTPIVHLRTGHGYFKSYFQRFNINLPKYICECGETNQTRTHLLLQCPTYKDARRTFIPNDPNEEWTSHTLLHTKEGLGKTLAFVTATGVSTRRWFTREDIDTPLGGTQERTRRDLETGLGRLNLETESEGSGENTDGSIMDPVEEFERLEEARGVESFRDMDMEAVMRYDMMGS